MSRGGLHPRISCPRVACTAHGSRPIGVARRSRNARRAAAKTRAIRPRARQARIGFNAKRRAAAIGGSLSSRCSGGERGLTSKIVHNDSSRADGLPSTPASRGRAGNPHLNFGVAGRGRINRGGAILILSRTLAAVAITAILAGSALAETSTNATSTSQTPQTSAANKQPVNAEDRAFLDYAAQDNQAEIQLCLIAEKQASAGAVKAFARLMVDDHVAVENQLALLANDLDIQLPKGVGKEGEDLMSRLKDLRGPNFDRSFMQAQVSDHRNDVKKYNDQIQSTKSEGVRSYATETVGVLKQHLDLAETVLAAVKQQPSQSSKM